MAQSDDKINEILITIEEIKNKKWSIQQAIKFCQVKTRESKRETSFNYSINENGLREVKTSIYIGNDFAVYNPGFNRKNNYGMFHTHPITSPDNERFQFSAHDLYGLKKEGCLEGILGRYIEDPLLLIEVADYDKDLEQFLERFEEIEDNYSKIFSLERKISTDKNNSNHIDLNETEKDKLKKELEEITFINKQKFKYIISDFVELHEVLVSKGIIKKVFLNRL